jgi:hypothetical protein
MQFLRLLLAVLCAGAFSALGTETTRDQFRPIVLIHGIGNFPKSWDLFIVAVQKTRKNQKLVELRSPFEGDESSWVGLHYQVAWFKKELHKLTRARE